MDYDFKTENRQFLERTGFLSLIGTKGPYRSYMLNEKINGVKVIDNVSEVIAGDDAYSGNRWGKVVSNVLASSIRTITVKYRDIPKAAGASDAEYDTDAERTETVLYTVNEGNVGTNETNRKANPWLQLASIGALFARKLQSADIVLESANPVIIAGATAVSLDFNIAGVSVQKIVNGVASGSPVVANGSGVASMPNGNTAGQSITYTVSKAGVETRTIGPFVVQPVTP